MNEKEYLKSLVRIEELMDAELGSSEEEELELLVSQVVNYENEHFPME